MIKQFNRGLHSDYIDIIYDFKGPWDVPSKCGLKLVQKPEHTIVIATEIYAENPGTSVTSFCAQLAGILCKEYSILPKNLVFIVHDPDSKSKLSFMNEYFYRVDFMWDGEKFIRPTWSQIDKAVIDKLMKG